MSPVKACHVRILIDQFDLSGESNSLQANSDLAALDYNVFQTCSTLRIPQDPEWGFEHNGYFFGDLPENFESNLYAHLGVEGVIATFLFGTNLPVVPAYTIFTGWNQQMRLEAATKQLIMVSGRWINGNDVTLRGYQVFYGTITGTGAQTHIDLGEAGADGGRVVIHVIEAPDLTNGAIINLQSDDNTDFSSAAEEASFEFDEVGAYSATFSGAIDRYVRAQVEAIGDATAITFALIVYPAGVTY